jgi:hypothetical protein
MSFYTTVSMKDALEVKAHGGAGADFLMTCAMTPVYSIPASKFFGLYKQAPTDDKKTTTVTGEKPPVSITITNTPAEFPPKKEISIPTLAEFHALPTDKKGRWECLTCCAPALADSYMPGSYCSKMCAYLGYI